MGIVSFGTNEPDFVDQVCYMDVGISELRRFIVVGTAIIGFGIVFVIRDLLPVE